MNLIFGKIKRGKKCACHGDLDGAEVLLAVSQVEGDTDNDDDDDTDGQQKEDAAAQTFPQFLVDAPSLDERYVARVQRKVQANCIFL